MSSLGGLLFRGRLLVQPQELLYSGVPSGQPKNGRWQGVAASPHYRKHKRNKRPEPGSHSGDAVQGLRRELSCQSLGGHGSREFSLRRWLLTPRSGNEAAVKSTYKYQVFVNSELLPILHQ